jgi:hypothetical protein
MSPPGEKAQRRYPPKIYEDLRRALRVPDNITDEEIRLAMLWKWGHLRKERIPSHHEALISWAALSPGVSGCAAAGES